MRKIACLLLFIGCLALYSCEKPIIEEDDIKKEEPAEPKPPTNNVPPQKGKGGSSKKGNDTGKSPNNGEGTGKGGSSEHYDMEHPMSVYKFLTTVPNNEKMYVVGYIIGAFKRNLKDVEWNAPFTSGLYILLADNKDERDLSKVMVLCLSKVSNKNKYNLKKHSDNMGRKLLLFGRKQAFSGVIGMKDYVGICAFWEEI